MALTHERVREMLHYDPETGVLTWRKNRRMGPKLIGKVAGYVDGNGRRLIEIDREIFHVGPLIWFWMTGKGPVGKVDHKDRDPLNNRWANLRDVTKGVDAQNRSLNSNNKSGVRGVYWNKQAGKWHAQIAKDRKKIHLGHFAEFTAAVAARKQAEISLWDLPKGG